MEWANAEKSPLCFHIRGYLLIAGDICTRGHAQADFGEVMAVIGGVAQNMSLRRICPTAMPAYPAAVSGRGLTFMYSSAASPQSVVYDLMEAGDKRRRLWLQKLIVGSTLPIINEPRFVPRGKTGGRAAV